MKKILPIIVLFLFTFSGYLAAQSITLADDGDITEGAENMEEITVTLSDDTFEATIDDGNISVTNLPGGVTYSITRDSDTQLTITLTHNRTQDYDLAITDLTVSILHNELVTLSSGSVDASSGVTFTATNDTESMSMADDGTIDEGSEGGEEITVTLTGGTFVSSLNTDNWTLANLPAGVTKGPVSRENDTEVKITLNNDRDDDYDSNIINLTLTVSADEVDDTTGSAFVMNSGVTFVANNDVESISMTDDGDITEAHENGEEITVTLTGGTFVSPLTSASWALTNLPTGVTKGTITRTGSTTATIELSGDRTVDYSADIEDLTLTIQSSEINDTSGGSGLTVNTGVTFTAVDEPFATLTSGTPQICAGQTYNLEVSVSIGNDPWDVTYRKPDMSEVTLNDKPTSFTIEVSDPGEYILTAVEDDDGVAGSVSGTVTLTVNPLPTPTIDGETTPCNGAREVYKAVGTAGSTFEWEILDDGTAVGDLTNDSLVVDWTWNNSHTNGHLKLTETTNKGCEDDVNNWEVNFQDSPAKPTIDSDPTGETEFCEGLSLTLRSSRPTGTTSWLWSNDIATRNNTVNETGSYTVRAINSNGCYSPVSNSYSVTKNPKPLAAIAVQGDNSICVDEDGTWKVSLYEGTNPISVTYSGESSGTEVTSAAYFELTSSSSFATTMTYTITAVTDDKGCTGQILGDTSEDITVNAKPTVTFTPANTSFLNTSPPVDLTSGLPAGPGGVYSGDAVTGSQFHPSLADTVSPNPVTFNYTDANGCSDFATVQFTVTVAKGDFTAEHAFDNGSGALIYCSYTPFDTLTGVVQEFIPGGYFEGKGIINPVPDLAFFNPATAGAGDHLITYWYKASLNPPVNTIYEWASITKTFRVDDPGSMLISALDRAYCANNDSTEVILSGSINNDGVPGFNGVEQLTGLGVSNPFPDIYYFDPKKGSPGERVVSYNYTRDFSQCTIVDTFKVIVDALPQITFDILDSCIFLTSGTDSIHFSNTSPVQSPSIVTWDWNFGDAQHSSVVSPWHDYNSVGTKLIKLTAVNDRGCTDYVQKIKEFQEITRALFDWENECLGDTMHFMFNFSEVEGTAVSWKWDFDDGTVSPGITNSEPYHKYDLSDNYEVVLKVENDFGCRDAVTQTVPVRPTFLVNAANPYFEDFEAGTGGWLTDADEGSYNSWEFGQPSGTIFSDITLGDAWVTSLGGLYVSDEKSYVESPCFDFSEIKKPMVRMDVWVHTENTRDGAAIQTSIDDGKTWTVLGSNLDGINWYNSALLTGEPGGQRLGWTGTSQSAWKQARNRIDQLKGKKFRMRVAFGSDAVASNFEGFAFDNVWVGERTRMVLLEHFTNSTSAESLDADPDVNGITNQNPKEVIDIQYHTSFPGEDSRNIYFPSGPSSRTLYYGVASVPYSMMDGIETFSGFDPVTLDYNWMELDLLKNVLIDPLATVNLSTSHIVGNNIYVEANLGLIDTTLSTANLTLHIAIVENESSVYESVLKKMLPDAGGTSLIDLWDGNNSAMVYQSWSFTPADFVAVDSLILIAFIQNEDTKDVYQAAYLTFKSILTGIFDSPVNVSELDYLVYPNPASGELFLKFEQVLEGRSQMHVFNELGALVDLIKLEKGNDLYSFDVSNYNQGVYFIQVTDADNNAMGWKRFIVIH